MSWASECPILGHFVNNFEHFLYTFFAAARAVGSSSQVAATMPLLTSNISLATSGGLWGNYPIRRCDWAREFASFNGEVQPRLERLNLANRRIAPRTYYFLIDHTLSENEMRMNTDSLRMSTDWGCRCAGLPIGRFSWSNGCRGATSTCFGRQGGAEGYNALYLQGLSRVFLRKGSGGLAGTRTLDQRLNWPLCRRS